MMMISFLNRHYLHSLSDRKAALKQIQQSLPEDSKAHEEVSLLGDELIAHQSAVLPKLQEIADANQEMAHLYSRYDELKLKRFRLNGTMDVDLEELKQEMERKKRRFMEGEH